MGISKETSKTRFVVFPHFSLLINFNEEGQEIGSGNFGRVVKAEAVGLKDADENVTTVAVKMVKPTAKSQDAIVALVRELKILIYLGEHLNVVNLLGACTKTNVRGKIQRHENMKENFKFCTFNCRRISCHHRFLSIRQFKILFNKKPEPFRQPVEWIRRYVTRVRNG
jgi:serine/threonine protein kinase